MGDPAPGWYEDDEDGRLARWWDGQVWTRHTLVIAEQLPGTEPLPPRASTRFPVPPAPDEWLDDPTYADGAEPPEYGLDDELYDSLAFDDAYADEYDAGTHDPLGDLGVRGWPAIPVDGDDGGGWRRLAPDDDLGFTPPHRERRRVRIEPDPEPASLVERVRDLPTWLRVVAPVAAVLVALGAVASAGALRSDGQDPPPTTSVTAQLDPVQLRAAADAALSAAGVSWFTRQGFIASIPATCVAAEADDPQRVADRVLLLGYDDPTTAHLIDGLEAGAESFCPEAVRDHPGFFGDVFRAAGVDREVALATTTTAPDVTSTTTTTRPPTATTRKATPTTKPAATTTAPPAPTTTAPSATTTTVAPTTTATTVVCVTEPC